MLQRENEERAVRMMHTVLIVEDNVELLGLLREVLSRDYEIHVARHGEEAIDLARRVQPRVVILDLQLPTIDGLEVARWIKSELGATGVAILVLTALSAPADMRTVIAADWCDAYMAKPASVAEIRGKVNELIESSRAA
jgi:DNA-binding response OmpR family regulator